LGMKFDERGNPLPVTSQPVSEQPSWGQES